MGWSRVESPNDVVRPGDAVTVKVLRVDDDGRKIALGMKQLQDDPWASVPAKYPVGLMTMGRVTRLAEFGAFIELEPGIEALAHESSFEVAGRRDAWKATVPPGSAVAVEILSVDVAKKRIGVAVRPEMAQAEEAPASGAAPVEGFGSLADKFRAALGTPKGSNK
jgi:small subunit ribosomal protein S1